MRGNPMKTITKLAALAAASVCLSAGADTVKFLADGNPSAIRIQGVAKTLEVEKAEWKEGKLSGTYHVPLDQLETGISLRDRHMKEKYLETAKYPKADLSIADCAPSEAAESSCEGTLTLRGITKKVPLKVKWTKLAAEGTAKRWKADTEFGLKLSDYGIALPKFANITVAEDVTVQVESETVQQ
jgi:polyisoprenoid-binding protein YceI